MKFAIHGRGSPGKVLGTVLYDLSFVDNEAEDKSINQRIGNFSCWNSDS